MYEIISRAIEFFYEKLFYIRSRVPLFSSNRFSKVLFPYSLPPLYTFEDFSTVLDPYAIERFESHLQISFDVDFLFQRKRKKSRNPKEISFRHWLRKRCFREKNSTAHDKWVHKRNSKPILM